MPAFTPKPNASKAEIDQWAATIKDPKASVTSRVHAMWGLRHAKDGAATDALIDYVKPFTAPAPEANALLQHEAAYNLGQRGDVKAIAALTEVLKNEKHEAIVRHEAAEALAALASCSNTDKAQLKAALQEFVNSPIGPLAETCQVGVGRVDWATAGPPKDADAEMASAKFPTTTDPAPSFAPGHGKTAAQLKELVLAPSGVELFARYQAMYTLRNEYLKAPTSADVIAGLIAALETPTSPLLRHQTAFVLGECGVKESADALLKRLEDTQEAPMVRHEAAFALGKLLDAGKCGQNVKEALTRLCKDPEPVVRDSCAHALLRDDYVA